MFFLQDTCWLLLMLGKEQTRLAQGIFLFLFILGDHMPDSEETPISTVLFSLSPKENLAQVCLKFSSWGLRVGWFIWVWVCCFF